MERTELRRIITVLALLLLCAPIVLYSSLHHTAKAASSGLRLPDTLGAWTKTRDISFRDGVIAILGTQDVRGGVYEDAAKNEVQIVIVQAVDNRSAFHPPEYCLTGGGSEIVEKSVKTVAAVPGIAGTFAVNEMVFKSSSAKNNLLVWNWYAVEKQMMPNFYRQQWQLVSAKFKSGSARGAVINMYTEMNGDDKDAADRLNADVTRALVPFLNSNL